MGRRSKVFELPPEVRDELNARLVANGFRDYEALAGWLAERGIQISKSALGRYGQSLQEDFEAAMADVKKATELARAYVAGDADEQAALVDANARIAQEALLRILIELRKASDEPAKAAKHIAQVTRALADLGRVSISQKKWAAEVRARAEAAAAKVETIAKKGGLSEKTVQDIRREILGIPS